MTYAHAAATDLCMRIVILPRWNHHAPTKIPLCLLGNGGLGSPWLWAALAVVAVVVYLGLRPRYDFAITVRRGEVRFHGKFPQHKEGAIAEFFRRDFPRQPRLTIHARRTGDGRLNLNIRGRLEPGEKQRLRNFLLAEF